MTHTRHFEFLSTAAHPERLEEIVALLTQCYAASPLFVHMFQEEHVREALQIKNRCRLSIAAQNGQSWFWLDEDGIAVEGHLVIQQAVTPTEAQAIEQQRLRQLQSRDLRSLLGDAAAFREEVTVRAIISRKAECLAQLPPVDHDFSFNMFAVRPESQGRGVGSSAMRQALQQLVVEPFATGEARVRVTLMSQMMRNVALYQRIGFDTIDQQSLTSKEDETMNIPNVVMVRHFGGHAD